MTLNKACAVEERELGSSNLGHIILGGPGSGSIQYSNLIWY